MNVTPPALPWARALIGAGPGFPRYGTPEWDALDDRDPRKVAACVAAAECWRAESHPEWIAWRARAELDWWQPEDAEPKWTPEVVAEVRRTANRPTHAQLCESRGESTKATRARWHERRMERYIVDGDAEQSDSPERHLDGTPVRYRAVLRAVPDVG